MGASIGHRESGAGGGTNLESTDPAVVELALEILGTFNFKGLYTLSLAGQVKLTRDRLLSERVCAGLCSELSRG